MLNSALILSGLYAATFAQSVGPFSAGTVIPWKPSAASSVDQSTVNNGIYYLADRTNAGVHVINLANNTEITLIKGFVTGLVGGVVTSSISGPDGVVPLADKNELWVGDGDGGIKVISLATNTIVANISTGSTKRVDEFAYDPKSGIVVATNPNEPTPYISVVSANNRTLMGKIMFNNASGLEQPAFDSVSGTFYASVPSTGQYPDGCISTLNLTSMTIGKTFKLPPCKPAGIIFGSSQHLFVTCSQDQILSYGYAASYVIDGNNGSVIANISGLAGVDQVAYDPNAKLFFASAYQMLNGTTPMPVLTIVNATTNKIVQQIPTDNSTAHSVAVDPKTGKFYVPIKAKGIQVYSLATSNTTSSNGTKTSGSATSATSASLGSMVAPPVAITQTFGLVVGLMVCCLLL